MLVFRACCHKEVWRPLRSLIYSVHDRFSFSVPESGPCGQRKFPTDTWEKKAVAFVTRVCKRD